MAEHVWRCTGILSDTTTLIDSWRHLPRLIIYRFQACASGGTLLYFVSQTQDFPDWCGNLR